MTIFFWRKQIIVSYIDYGEGSYLYELFLMDQKKVIYKDFFAPQPPLFYLFGYLIYRLSTSILFFKTLLMIINIISYIFFYFSIKKIFDNKIAFFSILFSFLFSNSIFRWSSFTGEIFLRFFLSFFLIICIYSKKNNFLFLKAMILLAGFFTKYYFGVFIFFYFLYLFFKEKKLFLNFLKLFLFLLISFLIVFYLFFNEQFVVQSIFNRKLIGLKNYQLSISSTIYFILKFFPFFFFNFLLFIKEIKKNDFLKGLFFLISISWIFNLYFNFLEGTYLYVFFPIEPIILVGFFNFIFRKDHFYKLTIISLFFYSFLSLFYQFQVFFDLFFLATNKYDIESTKKIVKLIEKSPEPVISPPYFAFLAKKRLIDNFHDPFFALQYLKKKDSENKIKLFENSFDKLTKIHPSIIFVDWRIEGILNIINKDFLKKYSFLEKVIFLNNENETIKIYKRIN